MSSPTIREKIWKNGVGRERRGVIHEMTPVRTSNEQMALMGEFFNFSKKEGEDPFAIEQKLPAIVAQLDLSLKS